MIEQLGGRKFIGFVIITLMLFVLVLVSKLEANAFLAFITANFGIYVVGNVSNKVVVKSQPAV